MCTPTYAYLRSRVDLRPLVGVLAVGDSLALTVFVVVGAVSHGRQPLSNPGPVAAILVPFLLAWGAVALLGGLYTADAVADVRRVLGRTVPAWVVAALLGQGLRATPLFRGGTSVAFALVTLVVGGALVGGWRAAFALGRTAVG